MKWISAGFVLPFAAAAASLVQVADKTGPIRQETIALPSLSPAGQYSLLYSVSPLRGLGPGARIDLELRQGDALLAAKTLHAGDPDYYVQFRVPQAGAAKLSIRATQAAGRYQLQVNQWPRSGSVKSGPNHRWQDAMPISPGSTVFASGDDAEYSRYPARRAAPSSRDPDGIDWYRFEFTSETPKLVFFQIDLTERDQIPSNVAIYRLADGKLQEYYEGEDPVTLPHEAQALPGNKFTPRILKDKGTYYVGVRANHPEYKLRTRVYDAPPYRDPRIAVRTALDYILAAGDSWHGNTPRKGGVIDRVSSVHQETSLCVGCHTTHFPLRAALYAARNGYPVVERQQLQFLTERFYNNPRPFYGFEARGRRVGARDFSAGQRTGAHVALARSFRGPGFGRAPRGLSRRHRPILESVLRGARQAAARRD